MSLWGANEELFVSWSTGTGNFEKNWEEMGSENMKYRELVHDNEYYFDDSINPLIWKKKDEVLFQRRLLWILKWKT